MTCTDTVLILILQHICSAVYLPADTPPNSRHYSQEFQYSHKEILNGTTETIVQWEVNPKQTPDSVIIFTFSSRLENIKEEDKARVAILLGLSKRGHVTGSDVAAVAIDGSDSGKVFDMHGLNNDTIILDKRQDWNLRSVKQNHTHVWFKVSRFLDTCDLEDVPIKNDLLRIIWGFTKVNKSQEVSSLRFIPQGLLRAYLLDPTIPNHQTLPGSQTMSWRISHKIHMPTHLTTYACTIHRRPFLPRKHHGGVPYFKDDASQQHVHHMLVHRCFPRPGMDAEKMFEKYVDQPWEECNLVWKHQLPTTYCIEIVAAWGIGGRGFYLPSDVGFAFGEEQHEYFMLETHLNNPDGRADLFVEVGMDLMYSPQLRPIEGGIVLVGSGVFGLFQIPPRTKNFRVAGHCSSGCTRRMISPSGVQVLAVAHHTHLTGRKIILRHFRGSRELKWISSDFNYEIQHARLLSKRVTIYPGDHLTTECMYDTSSRNGSSVAGFSTTDEMCVAFLVLDKVLPFAYCSSEYPTYRTMARYDIHAMVWNPEKSERIVTAASNKSYVGHSLQNVMDWVDGSFWTEEKVRALENEQLYQWHDSACAPVKMMQTLGHALDFLDEATAGYIPTGVIVDRLRISPETLSSSLLPGIQSARYPFITHIYRPPNTCQGNGSLGNFTGLF